MYYVCISSYLSTRVLWLKRYFRVRIIPLLYEKLYIKRNFKNGICNNRDYENIDFRSDDPRLKVNRQPMSRLIHPQCENSKAAGVTRTKLKEILNKKLIRFIGSPTSTDERERTSL